MSFRSGLTSVIGAVVGAAALSSSGAAQDRLLVADEYKISCQVCHGPRGRGDGPMAPNLTRKPSDLTTLEQKNDYKFPFLKVFQTIDGRAEIPAHGTREMPVWGRRYIEEVGEKYGPYGGEAAVRARVLELVYYVQSLQER
ncbi:MAG: cytochrome C [Hyphomicrobiaceae bacterium]|nr:cytochrome C [Hyphomicrobiaceae bacterium]